ncbi:hypothetical protein HY494_01435, partial [Candidatus Woesearchaeota archaeon]|nr:hypothetical protein [Candidatus Woesearchaeota archaeon]
GSGFQDQNQFKSTIEFVTNYSGDQNGLFSFEPFKSNKTKFNVWMVDKYKTYQLYQIPIVNKWIFDLLPSNHAYEACPFGNEFVLLSLYPRFQSWVRADINVLGLGDYTGKPTHFVNMSVGREAVGQLPFPVDVSASNPYDANCAGYGDHPQCGSGAYNPDDLQRLLAHEFGHSFGGLFDEYQTGNMTAKNSGTLANCDHNNICPKWSYILGTGCSLACGFDNWYRPYDANTIMGDHRIVRHEYEQVNKNRLQSILENYPTATFYDQITDVYQTFVLNASISGGNISLNSVSFVPGGAPEIQNFSNSPYTLKEFSKTNEVLYDYNFYVPMELNFENLSYLDTNNSQVLISDQNHSVALSDNNFSLSAPYLPNIARIAVFDKNGNQLFSFETGPYTKNSSIILGYGGSTLTSINYSLQYTLFPQIVGELNSSAYKLQLGWGVYNE